MTTKLPKRKSHLCNYRPISSGEKNDGKLFLSSCQQPPLSQSPHLFIVLIYKKAKQNSYFYQDIASALPSSKYNVTLLKFQRQRVQFRCNGSILKNILQCICWNLRLRCPLTSFSLNHVQNNKAKAAIKKEVFHIQEVFISKMKGIQIAR